MPTTPDLSKPRSIVEKRLDVAARVCLLLSGVAAAGGMFGYFLVWGPMVAPGWVVSTAFLFASLVIAVIRASTRRRLGRASGEAQHRHPSGWWVALTVIAVVCTGLLGFGDVALGARYTVLQPSGPSFCEAVVRETSFLMSGGGELYAVGFGGIARPVSSWTADDGYRPIDSGTYEFTWTTGGALLKVHGNGHDPVWPGLHGFDCS